jgi:hypothetical protein
MNERGPQFHFSEYILSDLLCNAWLALTYSLGSNHQFFKLLIRCFSATVNKAKTYKITFRWLDCKKLKVTKYKHITESLRCFNKFHTL